MVKNVVLFDMISRSCMMSPILRIGRVVTPFALAPRNLLRSSVASTFLPEDALMVAVSAATTSVGRRHQTTKPPNDLPPPGMGVTSSSNPLPQAGPSAAPSPFRGGNAKIQVRALELNKEAAKALDAGNVVGAVEMWSEAVQKLESSGFADHAIMIAPLHNLACAIGELGDLTKKIELLRKTLAVIKHAYSDQHPEFCKAQNNLAMALCELGRFDEAIAELQSAIAVQRRIHGPAHAKVARSLLNLGHVYACMKEPVLQLAALQEAHPIVLRHCGKEKIQYVASLVVLGEAQHANGLFRDATVTFEEGMQLEARMLGCSNVERGTTMMKMAALLRDQGKFPEALRTLNEALDIQRRVLGVKHPIFAETLRQFALVTQQRDQAVQPVGSVPGTSTSTMSHAANASASSMAVLEAMQQPPASTATDASSAAVAQAPPEDAFAPAPLLRRCLKIVDDYTSQHGEGNRVFWALRQSISLDLVELSMKSVPLDAATKVAAAKNVAKVDAALKGRGYADRHPERVRARDLLLQLA